MKKLVSIILLVFVFNLTTQAQKKGKRDRIKMTTEQHTNLAVKKMTLALDLSEKQQNQITPLIKAQAEERKAAMEKRMELREEKKRPTADEMYAMQSKRLDNQIAFKNRMKNILDKNQFEKFQKMAKNRAQKGKKMMKKGMEKRRMHKDTKE